MPKVESKPGAGVSKEGSGSAVGKSGSRTGIVVWRAAVGS